MEVGLLEASSNTGGMDPCIRPRSCPRPSPLLLQLSFLFTDLEGPPHFCCPRSRLLWPSPSSSSDSRRPLPRLRRVLSSSSPCSPRPSPRSRRPPAPGSPALPAFLSHPLHRLYLAFSTPLHLFRPFPTPLYPFRSSRSADGPLARIYIASGSQPGDLDGRPSFRDTVPLVW